MNEYLMLELTRQRGAEWQEAARLSRLARLAREQRAADRRRRSADRARCSGLPPVPDYVDGSFAADRQPAPATGRCL